MPRGRVKQSVDVECQCQQCGKVYSVPGWQEYGRKFCTRECWYASRSPRKKEPRPDFKCPTCGKLFQPRWPGQTRKHCSPECRAASRRTQLQERACVVCGTKFFARKSTRVRQFCSGVCRGSSTKGIAKREYVTDGTLLDTSGYRWITVPAEERQGHTHPLKAGRYLQEHIYKVEKALGRCLKRGIGAEVVHHINCNRLDNRNGNLLICSQEYHRYLHGEMSRRWAQEHLMFDPS